MIQVFALFVLFMVGCGPAPVPCEAELRSSEVSFDVPQMDWVVEPVAERAIDVVFVAEGYTASELGEYRAQVDQLRSALQEYPGGIVARAPGRVNVHRLDTPSRTHDVTNADRADSYFGSCLYPDDLKPPESWFLTGHIPRARALTLQHVPSADVVIVLVNSSFGRARTWWSGQHSLDFDPPLSPDAPAVVLLLKTDGAQVLTHELGHALANLGDEYSEGDTPFSFSGPWAGDPMWESANLTVDPLGGKWSGRVAGAEAGGGRASSGLYHPTRACLMAGNSPRFCPVCAAEMDRALALRPGTPDDPPRALVQFDTMGLVWVSVFDRDRTQSVVVNGVALSGFGDASRTVSQWSRFFGMVTRETVELEIEDGAGNRWVGTLPISR